MADYEHTKIFVGGIPWDTSEATLTDYFSRYGEIKSSNIAKDRYSGNPRGFAFVTFTDPSSVHKALGEHHEIAGRTVEVKKAKSRSVHQEYHQTHRESSVRSDITNSDGQFRTTKIFVGGLSANLTQEEFKNYFDKFGKITDVVLMHDNVTNRSRGFGFITFDSEDVVDDITRNCFHVLCGKYVEVKKAIPKEMSRNARDGQNQNSSSGPIGGYGHDNGHIGFYPVAGGYGGVYGPPHQMAWPRYGSVGYGRPMIAASTYWNGLGMVNYGTLPYGSSSGYQMNVVSGVGSLGVNNGGSYHEVQGKGAVLTTEGLRSTGNGFSTPKSNITNKGNHT